MAVYFFLMKKLKTGNLQVSQVYLPKFLQICNFSLLFSLSLLPPYVSAWDSTAFKKKAEAKKHSYILFHQLS